MTADTRTSLSKWSSPTKRKLFEKSSYRQGRVPNFSAVPMDIRPARRPVVKAHCPIKRIFEDTPSEGRTFIPKNRPQDVSPAQQVFSALTGILI